MYPEDRSKGRHKILCESVQCTSEHCVCFREIRLYPVYSLKINVLGHCRFSYNWRTSPNQQVYNLQRIREIYYCQIHSFSILLHTVGQLARCLMGPGDVC